MNRKISLTKRNYLHELMQKQSDTVYLRHTRDSIGMMHAELMHETGQYYNQIRQLCQEDQVERLNDFFIRAVQMEADPGMQTRGDRPLRHSDSRNFRKRNN